MWLIIPSTFLITVPQKKTNILGQYIELFLSNISLTYYLIAEGFPLLLQSFKIKYFAEKIHPDHRR